MTNSRPLFHSGPGSPLFTTEVQDQLLRIIQRAGRQCQPKFFENLHGARETELAEDFPMYVVCEWTGNSQPIVAKHYLRVTDDHFSKALQQPAVLPRTGSQSDLALSTQAPVLHGDAANCEKVSEGQAPRVGLEQSEDSPRRVAKIETGAAKSAAVGDEYDSDDPDLAQVIDAWHTLPPDTRTAILAIVEAAQGR